MEADRKRGIADGAVANGSFKRLRETESFQTGVGSKSKPCTKFFSTSGCPFGEGCHFSHFVPGGYHAVAQMVGLGSSTISSGRISANPSAIASAPSTPALKSRMCAKYTTAEGCKFGDKCRFAHGEQELGKPVVPQDVVLGPPTGRRMGGQHFEPPRAQQSMPSFSVPGSFGASATAKISIDASLAGPIIGKGGVNTKQICHVTGAKLFIRDHESDPSLKNIELEGTFDQINHASHLVKELILNVSTVTHLQKPAVMGYPGPGANFKTKMCDNFTNGSCTFGDRCKFAHGESELRKTV